MAASPTFARENISRLPSMVRSAKPRRAPRPSAWRAKCSRIQSSKTFAWRSSFEIHKLLDCGGKRSATPLWIGRDFSVSETSKAPSPLRSGGALQKAFLRGDRALKFGVIVFPGSNCDHDAYHVISKHVGQPVDFIWHRETDLSSYDAVIIPGGFSYGDYLRAGALARFSPVMNSVKEFAAQVKLLLGICNGFQILCEAGLLPGAVILNHEF